MTDLPIEDLNLTDTEYAQLLTQGYDPELERQLIVIGEAPDKARKMARFVGLLKGINDYWCVVGNFRWSADSPKADEWE